MSENNHNDNNDNDDDIEEQIQQLSDNLDLPIDAFRNITAEEIQYLLDHCPFLQIVGPEMLPEPEPVKMVKAISSGWMIHDYGDAMSSSPGYFLFGGGDFRIYLNDDEDDDDDGGEGSGGDVLNPGKGTIINQAFMTACEMVEMAKLRGWGLVTIVDGHRIMKRAAWIKCQDLGMILDGYSPTEEDERVRNLLLESTDMLKSRQAAIKRFEH